MSNPFKERTYFSGAQSEIYIGNYLIDEAIEIEGTYNLPQMPIYGYNSHHFSAVAQGKVIVAGSLIINYTQEGYLFALIKNYQDSKKIAIENSKPGTDIEQGENSTTDPELEGTQKKIIKTPSLLETTTITQGMIKNYKEKYWPQNKTMSQSSAPVRGEFAGPFNIKIKDFYLGYDKLRFEQKEFINCYINRLSTVRRIDGSPIVEVYPFIAQTLL